MRGLTPWQQRVAETYGGGDYAHITSVEEAKDVGDPLFTFLMIELDPKEGCDSEEEARRRITTAMLDLKDLLK